MHANRRIPSYHQINHDSYIKSEYDLLDIFAVERARWVYHHPGHDISWLLGAQKLIISVQGGELFIILLGHLSSMDFSHTPLHIGIHNSWTYRYGRNIWLFARDLPSKIVQRCFCGSICAPAFIGPCRCSRRSQ